MQLITNKIFYLDAAVPERETCKWDRCFLSTMWRHLHRLR